MATLSTIKVTPTVGEFSDVEPGMIFVIPFTIHNISNSVKRVRFGPPKTTYFRLINTQQSIAPGMKQVVEVEFTSKEVREVHDYLTIKTEEGEVQIPLHAWFPAPNVMCDPVIELGKVSMQHPVESKKFRLKNTGKRDGVFKFVEDTPVQGLSIVPQNGVVPAGKTLDVLLHYFPVETGLFRGAVSLQIDQQPSRLIEVAAEVVESRVGVVDQAHQSISRLSLGKLYFGQRTSKTVFVQNFSEHTVSFTIRPLEDHNAAAESDETQSHVNLPIECSPKEGRISGNGICPVTITFAPLMMETKRGWEHSQAPLEDLAKSWDLPFVVEVVETEQRIDLQIAGKATPTLVSLSESHFRFPDCAVNDHSDFLFSFVNENPELPCTFSLSRVAQFRCDPVSGTVGPKERQNVLLTFHPNQLGVFRGTTFLTLNGGVKKLPIVLSGAAGMIGPKPPAVGGPDKVREDFARPLKFARTSNSAPTGYNAPIAETPRETPADETDAPPDLLLMSEWQQKKEHNRLYNNFIANSRKVRDYNDKVSKGATLDTNPDDIGMIPGEGLDEPEPKITKREDRLAWTQQADASSKGEGPSLRKALRVDENKLIKKKFRREPSNLNEMRECKLELSPTDIQNIVTPIKVLDFQQVSVYSTNTKSFFVYNGLKTHIVVNIPFQRDELALSTPPSQVIPPGQIAGFDIVFRSETVQTFQQAIYFTINETHKLKFVVFAEVIPIDVAVSHKELQFRFPDFGADPAVTLPLTLTNNGNSNAEFQWGFSGEDPGAFSFQPPSGFVPASGTLSVNVTYTPVLTSNETTCESILRVKGGTGVKRVTLSGSVPNATCTWSVKDSRVDFKKLPVGAIRSQTISIKNSGNTSTVFAFDTSGLSSGMSISPIRGRIAPNTSEDVQLQLKATTAQPIKCNLSCHVRGMRQLLKAQVFAEAKIPDVTILDPAADSEETEPRLDFGGVYVGSFELRRIQVQNNDDVPAFFKLDLSGYTMFTIYDAERRAVEAVAGDRDDIGTNAVGHVAYYRQRTMDDEDASEVRRSNVFRIAINAHQTFHFYLAFTPSMVGALDTFVLPLSFAGVDQPSEMSTPILISGEGKKPRLVMTPSIVDFGSRVVSRENTSKIPNRILLRLTNETDADLPWELQGKHHETGSDVFRVEPTSGRLPPGQSSQVQFTFTPSEVKAFTSRYSIFLDGNKESKYMDIVAKGFGSNPLLTFDRKELILPPVPLDIVTRTTFYISNDGYESLDLRYKIAGDGKLPVSLAFPDGQTITSNHNVLPVEVSFVSKKPMTFTVNIDFYDDMDGIFSIPVTCTADNSLMTTFGYVKYREGSYSIGADGEKKPLMYTEAEDAMEKDTTPRHSRDGSSAAGQDDTTGNSFQTIDQVLKKTLTKRSIERLRNWLNGNLLHDPIDDLVSNLQSNQGKLVNDVIELLFGKGPSSVAKGNDNPASKPSEKGHKKEPTAAQSVVEPFEALLLFLKQYGACVSEIRSEFLLRYEDYCKFPGEGKQQKAQSKLPERKFAARSLHAWSTVVYQIIKVFYFSRITWKTLKSMPPTQPMHQISTAEKWNTLNNEPTCVGSNLYSGPECILLRWLSVHYSAVFGTKLGEKKKPNETGARVINFESDVRDCKAYAACVMSYIPPLAPKFDTSKENGFVLNPSSSTDLERNATFLLDAMREYGLDVRITGREFLDFGGRDHLLFSAYLFNALPQYIPKTAIKFKGKLLERITKQIEISNPTKWPVDYIVSLDGSDEFKITEPKLHLEPKATGNFTIQVTPRFSRKIDGRCMFLSSRGGTFSAATMIFNLETEVDSESALKTIDNLETPMYEAVHNEILVENPFPLNGQFSVQIQQEYVKEPGAKAFPEEASLALFPDAFWSNTDTLPIKKNEKAKFGLQFLPCVRGQYRARVTFKDDKVGEFAYVFVGTSHAPKAFDTVTVQTEAAVSIAREVSLPFRNVALEKAMQQKEERFKIFKGSRKGAQQKDAEHEGKETTYKLDFVNDKFVGPNPFFTGPKTFFVKSEQKDDEEALKKKSRNDKLQGQTFTITFTPKGPGSYNGFLLLTSPWDVRVLAIEGKSRSPGMKAELDFNCPARQQISQEIPITNASEKEWVVTAQLSGEYFSGPRELRVPSGRTKNYTLLFNPQWMCDTVGQLVLKNNDTQEKYTYALKGKAEEPLAENTIPVECKARETRKITINVPNITFDEVTYVIETDLPFVSGDSRITVPKMEVGKYVLNINPQISGKTTGSITFIAPNKQYVWFVLQLSVLRPPPEDTITIEAEVRKGAVAEISITNPTSRLVDFTVRRKGEGLFGDDILTIEPNRSAVYQLAFAPVKSGTVDGVISFNNDDIGEFWYRLALVGKDAAPQLLTFQCEIGKSTTQEVFIQNPLDVECTMLVTNSNDVNYTVVPQQLVLKPNASSRAAITYIPSAMQSGQEALIRMVHNAAGLWEFKCRGTGLPPTKMDSITCVAQVGRMSSVNVMFRNPFPMPKKFSITLNSTESVFSLMHKKTTITLGPFQTTQISVAYQPTTIASHKASVVAQLQEQQSDSELTWEFPIAGVAEFSSLDAAPKLSCKSRRHSSTTLTFVLEGYQGNVSNEEFDAELVVGKEVSLAKAVQNSLTFERQPGQSPSPTSLLYDFQFSPLRPFSSTAEFLVKKKTGGVWRFPLTLEATSPDPDDIIVMEAAVNATTTVNFHLYNVLPQASHYTAYFTAESPQEFSVTPAKGILPPMPTSNQSARGSGTQFSVGFSSTQYGKTLVGYLMVDTEEMQWRYEVRGTLPKYQPPTNVHSKVQNRLRPETEDAMKRIQQNISKK